MNRARGRVLAILALAATTGLPVLLFLVRLRIITFRDDFTGFNAVGFLLGWALVLLLSGTLLGGLAWHADRHSWLARSAVAINGLLLAGLVSLLISLNW